MSVQAATSSAILRQRDTGSEVVVGSIAPLDIEPGAVATLLFNVNKSGLALSSFAVVEENREVNSVSGVIMTDKTTFSVEAEVQ